MPTDVPAILRGMAMLARQQRSLEVHEAYGRFCYGGPFAAVAAAKAEARQDRDDPVERRSS
jgi:hypothetical protein